MELLAVAVMQTVYLTRMNYCAYCKTQSVHICVYRYRKIKYMNSLQNQMRTLFSRVKHYEHTTQGIASLSPDEDTT